MRSPLTGSIPIIWNTLLWTSAFVDTMDQIDEVSQVFSDLPAYRSAEKMAAFIRELIASPDFNAVTNA